MEQKSPKTHLTDIVVSRLKMPGTYHDRSTPAFAIRVGKNRKTWFVIRGRERERTNIGQYPQVGLADARREAKKLLTETPVKHSKLSVADACNTYLEAIKTKKPRTQRDYGRILDKYLVPKFGKRKLSEITYDDVIGIADKLKVSEKSHSLKSRYETERN